ncbi:prepilin peptidase [Wohlfahrtiimonas larvae]|uniref:Prepilin leader peptidase/N-methyltransferase n=1 Tax=Wohlfahrtiimonas larvae TaxID=1157986 RepID=A0ABP9MBQ2_9GAMM|nr:A24 family peptidase [Wohlfahrtiimonas larvae]
MSIEPTVPIYILVFILGAAIGSFLNVVAYRLPKILFDKNYQLISDFLIEESGKRQRFLSGIKLLDKLLNRHDAAVLLEKQKILPVQGLWYLSKPQSSCPNCNHRIKFYENIPILGWLFLRGKCSGCHQKISMRYPLVEFLTGVLTVLVMGRLGFNVEGLFFAFFVWIIISLTLIDLEFRILPDELTNPMIWLGLILSYFGLISVPFKAAFLGAIIGYLSLWSINQIALLILKRDGIGAGDFKFLAMIGAWQGAGNLFNVILISSIAGAVVGIVVQNIRRQKGEQDDAIPYGPFLALGSMVVLLLNLNAESFFYLAR